MTQPWSLDLSSLTLPPDFLKDFPLLVAFKNDNNAPISREELEKEYCRLTNQPYPITEMVFARSWMLFRVCPCIINLYFPSILVVGIVSLTPTPLSHSCPLSHRGLPPVTFDGRRARKRRTYTHSYSLWSANSR